MLDFIRGTIRPLITFMLVATMIVLVVKQLPIPENLKTLTDLVVGFWFGQRVGNGGNGDAGK